MYLSYPVNYIQGSVTPKLRQILQFVAGTGIVLFITHQVSAYLLANANKSEILSIQEKGKLPWRRGLVVSSPPATKQIVAMGREIESRQGTGW
jgi:hypothetical protein